MNNEKLNQEIEKLKAEHALKEKAKKMLGNIDHLAFMTGRDDKIERICVKAKNPEEFRMGLRQFPATNKKTVISVSDKKHILNTPFRVDLYNPCRPNEWHPFTVKFSYDSEGIDMSIELGVEFIMDLLTVGERNITDSEYHYFIGVTHNKLRSMRVRCYNFNEEQVNWYGGGKTLMNIEEINRILNYILNYKEE